MRQRQDRSPETSLTSSHPTACAQAAPAPSASASASAPGASAGAAPAEVLVERHGRVGLLSLNRPQALNALGLPGVRLITDALRAWAADPGIVAVVLRGATVEGRPPALCAGGDLKFFHRAALAGDADLEAFFTEEYALNHLIHRYPKPYVALMDGIVMGGGMGISQGARWRVLTERSVLAMPETNIGLFPDVGGGWFLARCPGHVGEYLALTGHALHADDAVACGLGDLRVDARQLLGLTERLLQLRDAQDLPETLRAVARPPGAGELLRTREQVDRHFSAPDIGEVMASLRADASEFAQATLRVLEQRSPLMLGVALEQVRRARGMRLADELRMERDIMFHCFHPAGGGHGDAVEGIRALVIDKDRKPRWNPARVEQVDPRAVAGFFVSPWPSPAHPLAALRDD
ncbi:MAG: enoyl-CoA hydratase/isomerase family protein [Betaproteobacteria bacterium]|nr:enoyl-CoA hydratase/isomerase family protein [Betaproteobacteria bacterium]